jgi:hypothetical protein
MTETATDFFSKPRTFVRVYRLPEKLTDGYCFGGGVPIIFTNVDWFEALTEEGLAVVEAFIRSKRYARPGKYLVLADDPRLTFQFDILKAKPTEGVHGG